MTVTVTHNKVSTIPDTSDTDLVRPSDWNANHTVVGLGTAAELNAGTANGVATLDAGGTIPLSQIPASLQGGVSYQGTWNATTNSPTLTSGVGTKGYYYVVSVAGSTNLDGITTWNVGDWAIFNGTAWQKVDNTDAVTSVNGFTGSVVLTTTNVAEGTNEYFTQARARTSLSAGTGISYDNTTGVITNSSPSLGGDVVGPASATDNAIARYDGTTGKLIQNGNITQDDNGNLANVNAVSFDTTPATLPTAAGSLYWDSADGNQTLTLIMAGGDVMQQIGQEQYYRIKASASITNGQVVMFTGSVGNSGALTGAPATGLTASTAFTVMGIATQDIPNNQWGYVTSFGVVREINTSAYNDGDILYYDPSVAGGLTTTIPTAPNAKVQVCAVINAASNGQLFVRPSFGGALGQFEGDVQISSPTSGNTLIYDAVQGRWENANLSAGTGISVTNGAGSVTVANTDTGSAQNIFKNVAVSGQTTITADTNNDTLTLAAGAGVTLTTDATTDTVTITTVAIWGA